MLTKEDRAKQFLAFDALNGFYKELKEKEMEVEHEEKVSKKPKDIMHKNVEK